MEEKRRDPAGPNSPAATNSVGSSVKSGDSPATEPPLAPRRRGKKRNSTSSGFFGSSSAPPKRHAREKAAAAAAAAASGFSSFFPSIHNGPLTRARQLSDNNAAISSVLNAVNDDQIAAAAKDVSGGFEVREEVKVENEVYDVLEASIEAEFEAIRSRSDNAHVVPLAAGWFSWTEIHPIEKETLHSFFNGKSESRTPEIYMEIRNWIMKRFHTNSRTNIELKDLSELSTADSDSRQEIMEFLDHWGLINYHPFPINDSIANPSANVEKADKTDSLIEKLYQFENEQSCQQVFPRAKTSTLAMPTGLFRESTIAEELVKQEGPSVEYHCNSCAADCSRKRYHCQKQADFDLCTECYNNGMFGCGMFPADFILMEPAEGSSASGGKWTDQETLLLLEAIELYKENWNEIAEHVATKTKAQCILHFLQMPIEDGFLDDPLQDIAEPTSISNDFPIPKDTSEPSSEGKTDKDSSEPVVGESGKHNSGQSESTNSENDPEPPECKTDTNTAQPVSTAIEASNLGDSLDGEGAEHRDDEIVLKALREAFNLVDFPPTPDDKLSFAEAGNSVMALAAFLTRLVDPGVASASARCSLKCMSKSSSGLQLAARHCFVLEDPPDDKKDENGFDSVATKKINHSGPEPVNQESENDKDINCNDENSARKSEKKSTPLLDGTRTYNDKEGGSGENKRLPSGVKDVHVEKPQGAEKTDEKKSQVAEKSDGVKSQTADTSAEGNSRVAEKPGQEKSYVNEPAEQKKGLKDSQNPVVPNDMPPANQKGVDHSASKVKPLDFANESENVSAAGDVQSTEVPTLVDMKEQSDAVVKVGLETVDNMEVDKTGDPKSMENAKVKDDSDVAKLKRAALATLSAAAVKAKLLANQEEDEIRHLATLLIDKQLRKLEIKLSFFTEMENSVMRVREQLDRSRHKLFNERAQIIASRLGLSGPSSRVLPSSFPANRVPPGLLNTMLRPPGNMAAQRPSMPRPVTASSLTTPNTSARSEVSGGGPTQHSAHERP